jgi:hypothetical protein
MLYQTTYLMHTSQKISCVNGPWCFVHMWLQLYMHQIVAIDLNNRHFPSTNYKEGETQSTKGCQTYGEAASIVSINQSIGQVFELFFRGFTDPLWLPYLDNDNLTLPCEFSFETECNDVHSIAIFNAFIHPCILPAEFCGGRQVQSTFEYYQPNMMARQLGCDQVHPRLFLHELQAQGGYEAIHASNKGFCVQVQHNCLCTQAFCANNSHSSFFHSLVARTS